jgi:hypothetical protein
MGFSPKGISALAIIAYNNKKSGTLGLFYIKMQ